MPIHHSFVPQSVQKVAPSSSCEPQLWQNRSGAGAGAGGGATGAGAEIAATGAGEVAVIGALSGASDREGGLFKAPGRRRTKNVCAGTRSQAGNWLANGESCWLLRGDGKLPGAGAEPPGRF